MDDDTRVRYGNPLISNCHETVYDEWHNNEKCRTELGVDRRQVVIL